MFERAAYDAKMVIYVPNGGAIPEFGHESTGHRKEMYDKMDQIYAAVMKER